MVTTVKNIYKDLGKVTYVILWAAVNTLIINMMRTLGYGMMFLHSNVSETDDFFHVTHLWMTPTWSTSHKTSIKLWKRHYYATHTKGYRSPGR
jgi:hypothetical protein